ncbi:MAG: cytidine/deoxycytidylate deaminase family protein [Acidobacteria bacterium]|nr:cytidine/deoxycytidylate deaminase family protein [Acidobacteriota bacterium]MCB9396193.1 cytidine/deoxycytidylate deaminase family protein [Acidobacteriota bacterium]
MTNTRPSWDEYFLGLVDAVAKRATCDRGRSGSLIVKDRQIVATGYVGSPPGHPHCDEDGHLFKQMLDEDGTVRTHCVRTIHAEQNAICQAARHGIAVQGATLYCSMEPCRTCAMLIASVGIRRVVAWRRYHAGQDSRMILAHSGVELVVIHEEVTSYQQQTGNQPESP